MPVTWERRDCVSTEVEGALVLLDLETLKYHSLNATASAIWEMLATERSDDDLVKSLCSRYEIEPMQCRESVDRLLQTLASSGLVKRVQTGLLPDSKH